MTKNVLFLVMEILDTKQTYSKIELMFSQSNRYFYIISPYFRVDLPLFKLLNSYRYNLNIICGKDEKGIDEAIESCFDARIMFCENLHSKIYLSEKSVIISSMNFYDYSIKNNIETSVFIDRSNYPFHWEQVYDQVRFIRKNSFREW